MIKIFRNIRQRLLKEGKVTRYLAYAIGEIILVVIGILIALQLNNWNEQRKNDIAIKGILKQIQTDLVAGIEQSDELIEFYLEKDSLIARVINDQVTHEDYRTNTKYRTLIMNHYPFSPEDKGVSALVQKTDLLTGDLKDINDELKAMYSRWTGSSLALLNEAIDEISDGPRYYLRDNFDGFSDLVFNKGISEEFFEYWLTDPSYKNLVTDYYIFANGNYLPFIQDYRASAIDIYKRISEELGTEVSSDSLSFITDLDDYRTAIGTYTSDTITVSIYLKDENLMISGLAAEEKVLYPLKNNHFMLDRTRFHSFRFLRDDTGSITGFEDRDRAKNQIYIKQENIVR